MGSAAAVPGPTRIVSDLPPPTPLLALTDLSRATPRIRVGPQDLLGQLARAGMDGWQRRGLARRLAEQAVFEASGMARRAWSAEAAQLGRADSDAGLDVGKALAMVRRQYAAPALRAQ